MRARPAAARRVCGIGKYSPFETTLRRDRRVQLVHVVGARQPGKLIVAEPHVLFAVSTHRHSFLPCSCSGEPHATNASSLRATRCVPGDNPEHRRLGLRSRRLSGCALAVDGRNLGQTAHDAPTRQHAEPLKTSLKIYRSRRSPATASARKSFPPASRCSKRSPQAASTFRFEFENFDWGGDYYREHGVMMPADGLDALRDKDAILFGSAGDPRHPRPHHAVGPAPEDLPGLRPVRQRAADAHPARHRRAAEALHAGGPDWVIVRENSEGEYAGVGGRVHQGHPIEVATDVSMMTRAGVERIMRFAFRLAQSRPRKLLTVITKSNAQRHAMVMWDEIALQVSKEFPDVDVGQGTGRRVAPRAWSTGRRRSTRIVATNLHADILSDLAAALAGSLGIAPTGNIDPGAPLPVDVRADPRLGVRHHGQGPGQSGRHVLVGRDAARAPRRERSRAPSSMQAIEAVTADPTLHTRDLGGTATTARGHAMRCAAAC